MEPVHITTVYFDLGDTLGAPVLSPPPIHLIGFEVFDVAMPVLDELSDLGLRLGVISNTGDDDGGAVDAVLSTAGIRDCFAPELRIYSRDVGLRKDSPAIFRLAAARAGVPAGGCLFVGENDSERGFARQAGMAAAPHPLLARDVAAGMPVRRIRFTATVAGWPAMVAPLRVVPLTMAGDPVVVEAMAPDAAVPALTELGFAPEVLGDVPTLPVPTSEMDGVS
ncbi:MAG TPA: HAD family hydrolase [Actinoplanes sp.]